MAKRHARVERLREVPGIAVDRMGAAADAAAKKYPDLLRLENLDTDLPPPAAALQATKAAVAKDEDNSYLPFLGQHELRSVAARHVRRLSGVEYDANSQCLITAGGLSGCPITLLALLNVGDEVVMTDPT